MTTRLFIENATSLQWKMTNQDGIHEYMIAPNAIYSLKINYSPTFDRTYTLTSNNTQIIITLDTHGDIKCTIITGNNNADSILIALKNAEHHTLYNMLAPHCQYYGHQPDPLVISPYRCHVAGHYHNKILITPANNPSARVIPPTVASSVDHQESFTNSNCTILAFITR